MRSLSVGKAAAQFGSSIQIEPSGSEVGARAFEIAAIGKAPVGQDLFRDAGELGDIGVAAVGTDDEPGAQLGLLAAWGAEGDAGEGLALAQQGMCGLTEQQLDTGRGPRRLANHRVEQLAPEVDRHPSPLRRRFDPAPRRPGLEARPLATRLHDRLHQLEPFDRRHRGGLDEVGAHALEGHRVGLLLDQRHPRSRSAEQDRGGTTCKAATDDHGVVVECPGLSAVCGFAHGHLRCGKLLADDSHRTIRFE